MIYLKNCKCDNFNSRFLGLRDFCVQQFPFIAEDFDALTTYELLEKVVCYLKKIGKYTEEMGQKFKDLFDYVNGYFDNLDVESVINQIIQNMYDEGLITEAIDNILTQTEEKCRKLVYVNCYGAKGDGVTDDTSAIQRAIDENPFAIFIFHGTYLITDTIQVNRGCRTLLLTTLVWGGGTEEKAMMRIHRDSGQTSPEKSLSHSIIGGAFYGGKKAHTELQIDEYNVKVTNVQFRDFRVHGILLANTLSDFTLTNLKSTQCHITSCYFNNFPDTRGVGVGAVHTDNYITTSNFSGMMYGIGYWGGNMFVANTHFTPCPTNNPSAQYQTNIGYACEINPVGGPGTMEIAFNGCYFNGAIKGIAYVSAGSDHTLGVYSSFYISSCWTIAPDIDMYLIHGEKVQYHIDGLDIRRYDTSALYLAVKNSTTAKDQWRQEAKNIYNLNGTTSKRSEYDILNIGYIPKRISNSTYTVPAHKQLWFGSLVYQGNYSQCDLEIMRTQQAYRKVHISESRAEVTESVGITSLKLGFGDPRRLEINGVEFEEIPLYLINVSDNDLEDPTWVKMSPCVGSFTNPYTWFTTVDNRDRHLSNEMTNVSRFIDL